MAKNRTTSSRVFIGAMLVTITACGASGSENDTKAPEDVVEKEYISGFEEAKLFVGMPVVRADRTLKNLGWREVNSNLDAIPFSEKNMPPPICGKSGISTNYRKYRIVTSEKPPREKEILAKFELSCEPDQVLLGKFGTHKLSSVETNNVKNQ